MGCRVQRLLRRSCICRIVKEDLWFAVIQYGGRLAIGQPEVDRAVYGAQFLWCQIQKHPFRTIVQLVHHDIGLADTVIPERMGKTIALFIESLVRPLPLTQITGQGCPVGISVSVSHEAVEKGKIVFESVLEHGDIVRKLSVRRHVVTPLL